MLISGEGGWSDKNDILEGWVGWDWCSPCLKNCSAIPDFVFHFMTDFKDVTCLLNHLWRDFFLPLQEANSSTDYSEKFDHLLEVLSTPPLFTVVRVNSLKSNVHDVCQQLQVILYEVIIIIILIIIIIIIIITIILSPYEAFQLAIVQAWLRIWTRDYWEQT